MEENPNNGDERVSTVYINRDGAESIQWNWKLGSGVNDSLRWAPGFESIQWNWKMNRLGEPETVSGGGIHSMELKAATSPKSLPSTKATKNPFNGIESQSLLLARRAPKQPS